MKVMLVNEKTQHNLTPGEEYYVIGIEADDYRILDDGGQPYLYPEGDFRIIDDHEPADWVSEIGDDGERYAYPPELNRVGFFEDFFDLKSNAVKTFWNVMNRRLAKAA
jgi:hypothetical protein